MKRLIAGSVVSGGVYFYTESSLKSLLWGGVTYFVYEPDYVPFNVDNYPLMYFFMVLRRRFANLNATLISLGLKTDGDELERRRAMCKMNMPLCPKCNEEQIKIDHFVLHKFVPENVDSRRAIVFFHGGGFVIGSVPYYRWFLSNMATVMHLYDMILRQRLFGSIF